MTKKAEPIFREFKDFGGFCVSSFSTVAVRMNEKSIRERLVEHGQILFDAPKQPVAFTKEPQADALLNDLDNRPHAFALACVMDRQVKAERAWLIPYRISEKIGGFTMQALKFADYLLRYMLKWETKHSETLLNVEKLAQPFSYKLHIHADLPAAQGTAQTGGQTREKIADVPETFNYLLGLHVQTRQIHDDDGRRYLVYRGRIDHRQVVVIWRETEGWTKEDLERDKKFVAEQKLTEGADEIFVNGDSFIPNAKALEPVFKARMFAPVEA